MLFMNNKSYILGLDFKAMAKSLDLSLNLETVLQFFFTLIKYRSWSQDCNLGLNNPIQHSFFSS